MEMCIRDSCIIGIGTVVTLHSLRLLEEAKKSAAANQMENKASAGKNTENIMGIPKEEASANQADEEENTGKEKTEETAVEETEEMIVTVEQGREEYISTLENLESKVQSMWKTLEDNSDLGRKRAAEQEYSLWDTELNKIYAMLQDKLSEEDMEALRMEEREWIKTRDKIALEASEHSKTGGIENYEYVKSLSDSTKTRTYELVEIYFEYEE